MHLPEIDKYAHLKSVFHSWDPRVKLVCFSFLILSVALLPNLPSACAGLVLAIVLVFLSRIPFSFVLGNLRWVILFVLFFFIIMPLTVPGKIVVRLNFIAISQQGLRLALLIALRAIPHNPKSACKP
jgi:cobalt/nickel transport system permease protein